MQLTLLITGTLAGTWLLMVVYRSGVRRYLPWFAGYIWWVCLESAVQLALWLFNPWLYFEAYWWMEVIEIALIVAALRESFARIFKGFTGMPWFRRTVFAVIAAVIAYSAWKAIYAPPVQGSWITAFIIAGEFLFRWGIAGIGLLTIVLSWLLGAQSHTREDAVVTGFTLTSGAYVASVVNLSLFGTKYLFVSRALPSVGYFMATFFWIWAFSRPERGTGFEELGMGPDEMLTTMRNYGQAVKRIRGNQ